MQKKTGNNGAKYPTHLAKRLGWGALALAIVVAILFGLAHGKGSQARQAKRQALRVLTPTQVRTNGYTSSASCRACHPSQYASWHRSYHRTMTQLAGPHSVMGRFDGTEVESGGLLYRVFQTNGQYWATMPDPEIIMLAVETGQRVNDHTYQIRTNGVLSMLDLRTVPRVDKRVVMTTGSHHYQTYWVEGSVLNPTNQINEAKYGNLLQTLPLVYLPREQQWIPRENAFMMAPSSKRMISQWNHHCIKCHSTAGNPGIVANKITIPYTIRKGDTLSTIAKRHKTTEAAITKANDIKNPNDIQPGQELKLSKIQHTFDTRTAELGISCEACHGPAAGHAEHYRSPLARYAEQHRDAQAAKVVNPAKLDHRRSSQVCGQCHGVYIYNDAERGQRFARSGPAYRPGDNIHSIRYYIQHPGPAPTPERQEELEKNPEFFRERWWDDGTVLAGGREFTAMRVSACYTKGTMSCLSCHSMHHSDEVEPDSWRKDQLKPDMRGNAACVECHAKPEYTTAIERHTFHKPGSTGSNCLNCHMPHTTYALLGAIRNHQIQSPSAERSIRHGVPNACNLCHLDQTLDWTQQQLAKRYGHEPLPLSAEQRNTSAALLWLLKGHAAQRAITAWHAGWEPASEVSGEDWLAPHLARLLDDPYGVVRHIAKESLGKQTGFGGFEFDFLAGAPERARLAKRAIAQWSEQPGEASGAAILIEPDRQLMETAIQALLKRRDNRPFTIKE